MKALKPLVTAAVLAAVSVPAMARDLTVVPTDQLPGLSTTTSDYTVLYSHRPDWSYRIDRSVLYPIPRPFPWPGPGCLSCPSAPLDERIIMPRDLMR